MDGILLGMCNPLLDVSALVSPDFLEKYGLKSSNAILAEPSHLPLFEDLRKSYQIEYTAGGAGQNTIRATQWMLQKPNSTIYIGCVGKDENAKILKDEALNDGVSVHYLEDSTTPTGTCACLITNKERSLVAYLGAANNYKKEHFDSGEIQAIVNKAKYFYVTGFFLTVSPDTMIAIGKHAVETNKHYLVNLSAPFIIQFFYDKFTSVMPYVDVVFGNEHEFAALGSHNGWGEDLKTIARQLSLFPKENTKRPRIVIVTQGSQPTLIAGSDGTSLEIPTPIVPKDEIVDTNGAGDSFVGGFLSQYVQGQSLEHCVAAGCYCAGVTIRTSGIVFRGKTPTFA